MKKGDAVKDFRTENGKAIATIEVGGKWVSNPTIEQLKADGWVEIIKPTPKPYEPTRTEKINIEIRKRYSSDDEAQIVREKIAGKEGADERFAEYNAYVESILNKYPEE